MITKPQKQGDYKYLLFLNIVKISRKGRFYLFYFHKTTKTQVFTPAVLS